MKLRPEHIRALLSGVRARSASKRPSVSLPTDHALAALEELEELRALHTCFRCGHAKHETGADNGHLRPNTCAWCPACVKQAREPTPESGIFIAWGD